MQKNNTVNKANRFILNLFIAILFLFTMNSCSKSESEAENIYQYIDNAENDGITNMDVNGNYFFAIDNSDWKTNDAFSSPISALFTFSDTLDYSNAEKSTISMYPGFPNPIDLFLYLNLGSTKNTVFKYVVVDSTLTIKLKGARNLMSPGNFLFIDFQDTSLKSNSYYRMFYRFYYAPNKYYLSGHADLLKQ